MEKNKDDDDDDDDRQKLPLLAVNTSKYKWHRYVLQEVRY
jgi:hypothetical protein